MTTIFLGDSITEGYGVEASECWVSGMPEDAINRGISGDTTAGMLRRFPAHVLAAKPDRVVIMGGLNDLGEGVHWSQAANHLRVMCEWARREGIEPVLAVCVQPDYDEFLSSGWSYVLPAIHTLPEQFDALADWIRRYTKQEHILCLDFAQEFPKRITREYCRYFLDGEHPNRFGHAILRDIARDILG
ncbi:MAG: GDSL-type esterase/lipase family protein [Butyricicoccus sp.]